MYINSKLSTHSILTLRRHPNNMANFHIFLLLLSALATAWTLAPNVNHDQDLDEGFDAFETVQAEDYSTMHGGRVDYDPNANCTVVDYLVDGAVLTYYGVDFQDGAYAVELRVAGRLEFANPGFVSFHLDSETTTPFVTVMTRGLPNYTFVTLNQFIQDDVPVGVHDLHIALATDTSDYVIDFDWFQFYAN